MADINLKTEDLVTICNSYQDVFDGIIKIDCNKIETSGVSESVDRDIITLKEKMSKARSNIYQYVCKIKDELIPKVIVSLELSDEKALEDKSFRQLGQIVANSLMVNFTLEELTPKKVDDEMLNKLKEAGIDFSKPFNGISYDSKSGLVSKDGEFYEYCYMTLPTGAWDLTPEQLKLFIKHANTDTFLAGQNDNTVYENDNYDIKDLKFNGIGFFPSKQASENASKNALVDGSYAPMSDEIIDFQKWFIESTGNDGVHSIVGFSSGGNSAIIIAAKAEGLYQKALSYNYLAVQDDNANGRGADGNRITSENISSLNKYNVKVGFYMTPSGGANAWGKNDFEKYIDDLRANGLKFDYKIYDKDVDTNKSGHIPGGVARAIYDINNGK